jgi:hypothetical protein
MIPIGDRPELAEPSEHGIDGAGLSACDLRSERGDPPQVRVGRVRLSVNKTMENMAYALPSVAFDLMETRVSGGDSAIHVDSRDRIGSPMRSSGC